MKNQKKNNKKNYQIFTSEGFGKCTKTKVKLQVKENAIPVFKEKRNVPYAAIGLINQELDRLKRIGFISKVQHSEWAALTVYIKKKNKYIRVCTDFLTGLNKKSENL